MAMTKKEQAEMKAAIDRAETLAAFRWTSPVERDVEIPNDDDSEGWDYNVYTKTVSHCWSSRVSHGAFYNGKKSSGSQYGIRLYSTKLLALKAMRHEIERNVAADLLRIDRMIEEASK